MKKYLVREGLSGKEMEMFLNDSNKDYDVCNIFQIPVYIQKKEESGKKCVGCVYTVVLKHWSRI